MTAAPDAGPVTRDLGAFGPGGGDRLFVDSGLLALALMRDGCIERVTPEFLRLFGLPSGAGPRALADLARLLLRTLDADGTGEPGERALCPLRLPGGRGRTVELRVAHATVDGRDATALVATDTTEQAREHERLQHLAMHDPLTGLPNRALMRDRLEQAVAADRRHGRGCAVLLVDLDGFKAVNDRLGHAAGDALLEAVAARLKTCSRESDTVTRYGGDEFVVVAGPVGGDEEAAVLAARIVSELRRPFDLGGVQAQVGASVGIARRGAAGEDAALLLSEADAALYLAKGEGKNRYAFPQVDRDAIKATPDLAWPAEREVGIPHVDGEHAALARGMNALLARVRAGEDSQGLVRGLRELTLELGHHFATEERYMRSRPGDWDDEHREEHRRVMDDLRRLTAVVSDHSVALAIRYLQQWLLRHIDSYDRRLGQVAGADGGDGAVPAAHRAAE